MADGKKLNELRVCDLKDELEKRKLETIGPKASLIERLQKALKDEGHDPNNYVFNQKKSTPKKPFPSPIKSTNTLIKEEPLEEENSEEYGENGDYREHEEGDHYIDEVGTVDDECVIIDDEDDYEGEEEQAVEEEDEAEAEEENTTDGNNQDNEESINLTIGEEEQKLLHDEAPDDKDKSMPDVPVKSVDKDAGNKATGKENKSEQKSNHAATGKNEKKAGKDDDAATKHKSKNEDNATNDKKDDSDKPASKTTHKDDKEKSTTIATAADATKSAASSAKSTAPSRNLWVSGLSSLTRASDLKTIFSKHGKVIGAKVVTNTRTPGTRCYGYVTMSSSNDAGRCIEHLHRTELHGRIISVERTKNEIGGNSASSGQGKHSSTGTKKRDDDKRTSGKDAKTSTGGGAGDDKKKTDEKRKDSKRDDAKKEDKAKKDAKDETKDSAKDKEDKDRSDTASKRTTRRSPHRGAGNRDHDREREQRQKERERERERLRQREILSYQKIREERERQRLREKERELREEDRRRREIRERQRQEEQRLSDERKKLALERERLEREKAELLRLERERQKLEREKIELERLELKRQQMKIIHSRDDPVKRTTKRAGDDRYAEVPERKRSTANESRFEAPPPPRFDTALVAPRSYDKKREDYSSTSTTKRVIDEYATSKRTDYASKRDDYSGTTVKRSAALDEYPPAPPKRNTDDYSKRSTSDYISSASAKRGGLDYISSKRDDYKREVEIRHIPASSSSGGVNSTYHSNSLHKSSSSRYGDADMAVRSSANNFRRIDDRSAGSVKRYDTSSGYAGNNAWTSSTNSHMGHASGGAPSIKSYVSNGMSANMHSGGGGNAVWQKSGVVEESNWRGGISSQDRYDRTYNERSGTYIDTARTSGVYGGSGRSAADRYGGTISSRYDNGKY